MRYSSLFRSRWLALLWSVGILWSAASFVGWDAPGDDAPNEAVGDGDLNQLQNLVGRLKASQPSS